MKSTFLLSLILAFATIISIPTNISADPEPVVDCDEMVSACEETNPYHPIVNHMMHRIYDSDCEAAGENCIEQQEPE